MPYIYLQLYDPSMLHVFLRSIYKMTIVISLSDLHMYKNQASVGHSVPCVGMTLGRCVRASSHQPIYSLTGPLVQDL